MNKSQTTVLTLMVFAVLINGYGAVKNGKSIVGDILGGFVATTILLALSPAVPVIAEALAGAFMVTSLLHSGGIITDITKLLSDPTVSGATATTPPPAATPATTTHVTPAPTFATK